MERTPCWLGHGAAIPRLRSAPALHIREATTHNGALTWRRCSLNPGDLVTVCLVPDIASVEATLLVDAGGDKSVAAADRCGPSDDNTAGFAPKAPQCLSGIPC